MTAWIERVHKASKQGCAMKVYYNENDHGYCEWLRCLMEEGLIPVGTIDSRSIEDVRPDEVKDYDQRHWFAGIGGWAYALQLAGWGGRSCDTGSCPCQPYSSAGKRKGDADERNLWPAFYRLIRECRPTTIFGEQVASSDVIGTQLEASFVDAVQRGDYAAANKLAKRLAQSNGFHYAARWVDGVRRDLEGEGYALGFKVLGAHSVGAPHIRSRLYWVAHLRGERRKGRTEHDGRMGRPKQSAGDGVSIELANAASNDQQGPRECGKGNGPVQLPNRGHGSTGGLGDAASGGERQHGDGRSICPRESRQDGECNGGAWDSFDLIPCRDGKVRRVPACVESGVQPMVDGLPVDVGRMWTEGYGIHPLAKAFKGRAGLLRGAGNAIVPACAAVFIRAFLESESPAIKE